LGGCAYCLILFRPFAPTYMLGTIYPLLFQAKRCMNFIFLDLLAEIQA
jgi:hypothetical protein